MSNSKTREDFMQMYATMPLYYLQRHLQRARNGLKFDTELSTRDATLWAPYIEEDNIEIEVINSLIAQKDQIGSSQKSEEQTQ